MSKYYSTENLPPVAFSNPGEKEVIVLEAVLNEETKQHEFVKSDPVDWDGMIQASINSCDLENIIKRYEAGDADAIHVSDGVYSDVLSYPTDLRGMAEFSAKLENDFNNYDERFKAIFDNNYQTYVNDMLSGKAKEKIDAYNNAILAKQNEMEVK